MRPLFQWNPVTLKRWQRFRKMRRAWWSLWILAGLYAASLGAELLCNNRPLYVRFNGRSLFPAFRFYPEDLFLSNGKMTRPDYKAIASSPTFTATPGNFMIFPLVPYGPFEILTAESISVSESVDVVFTRYPRTGVVNVSPDFAVSRASEAAFFFGRKTDAETQGLTLTNHLAVSPGLLDGLARRFRNEASPGIETVVSSRLTRSPQWSASLSPYTPRSAPPQSIRLTLREGVASNAPAGKVTFDRDMRPVAASFPLWNALHAEARSNVMALAKTRISAPVERQTMAIEGQMYDVSFDKADVRWPYRPVPGHWLGIDNAGRDVLARVLYGLRTSMTFGFILVVLSMAFGIALGAVQGYFGGKVDITGQRLTEIWSALPFLYIMILLGAVYGRGFMLLLFCYAIFNWIGISYYIRAEFLRLRHLPFVEAAKASGLPHRKIIFRHILPNALVPVITFFPFNLVGAIGSLAALDYLGFGLPPPTPSWGELLQQAQQFRWAWWLILYPSLALFIVMLLGVFVGEGVRNAYDPRTASNWE